MSFKKKNLNLGSLGWRHPSELSRKGIGGGELGFCEVRESPLPLQGLGLSFWGYSDLIKSSYVGHHFINTNQDTAPHIGIFFFSFVAIT